MPKLKNLKFGDFIRNNHASDANPHKYGYFVEYKKRTGLVNRGEFIRLTDQKGHFWELPNEDDMDIEVFPFK